MGGGGSGGNGGDLRGERSPRIDELGLYAPIPGSRVELRDAASLSAQVAAGTANVEAEAEAAEPRSERPISPAEVARLQEIARHLPPSDRVQQMGRTAKDFFLGSNLRVQPFADAIDGSQVCRTP